MADRLGGELERPRGKGLSNVDAADARAVRPYSEALLRDLLFR